MTYTAEQLRRDAIAIERMHGETLTVEWRGHQASQLRAHADALEENARMKEELTWARTWIDAAVASCAKRGCAKKEYEATKEQRDRAERAEAELAKLRQHAEAMYQAWEYVEILPRDNDARIIAACDAYRADFPGEK